MTFIVFSHCSKVDVDFRILEKIWENFFGYVDNCISIGCFQQSLLLRENTCHCESIKKTSQNFTCY